MRARGQGSGQSLRPGVRQTRRVLQRVSATTALRLPAAPRADYTPLRTVSDEEAQQVLGLRREIKLTDWELQHHTPM